VTCEEVAARVKGGGETRAVKGALVVVGISLIVIVYTLYRGTPRVSTSLEMSVVRKKLLDSLEASSSSPPPDSSPRSPPSAPARDRGTFLSGDKGGSTHFKSERKKPQTCCGR
jgi:hypothetical protein